MIFRSVTVLNSRLGTVRNASYSIYILGIRILYMYCIVTTDGEMIPVILSGLQKRKFKKKIGKILAESINKENPNQSTTRNDIDSPLK